MSATRPFDLNTFSTPLRPLAYDRAGRAYKYVDHDIDQNVLHAAPVGEDYIVGRNLDGTFFGPFNPTQNDLICIGEGWGV